jgi:hypothetical protein
MKKNNENNSLVKKCTKGARAKTDDTEKSLSVISKEFGKQIRSRTSLVKKKVKATLREEMNHVSANSERLIHGKT